MIFATPSISTEDLILVGPSDVEYGEFTVREPSIVVPPKLPPTLKFPPIPTPPDTTRAPVEVNVD